VPHIEEQRGLARIKPPMGGMEMRLGTVTASDVEETLRAAPWFKDGFSVLSWSPLLSGNGLAQLC
jgi:hypothetical protein